MNQTLYRDHQANRRALRILLGSLSRIDPSTRKQTQDISTRLKDRGIDAAASNYLGSSITYLQSAIRNYRLASRERPPNWIDTLEIDETVVKSAIFRTKAKWIGEATAVSLNTGGKPVAYKLRIVDISRRSNRPVYAAGACVSVGWMKRVAPIYKVLDNTEFGYDRFLLTASLITSTPVVDVHTVVTASHIPPPNNRWQLGWQQVEIREEYLAFNPLTKAWAFGDTFLEAQKRFGFASRRIVGGKLIQKART